jgi:hypothetical protein
MIGWRISMTMELQNWRSDTCRRAKLTISDPDLRLSCFFFGDPYVKLK